MIRIAHRRNTVAELDATPQTLGVEVDIRTRNNSLIVHHDAFAEGELLESWLEHYHHGLLVLNVKEEGLEERLGDLMDRRGIEDFFFLDQSFPFLLKTAASAGAPCASRSLNRLKLRYRSPGGWTGCGWTVSHVFHSLPTERADWLPKAFVFVLYRQNCRGMRPRSGYRPCAGCF